MIAIGLFIAAFRARSLDVSVSQKLIVRCVIELLRSLLRKDIVLIKCLKPSLCLFVVELRRGSGLLPLRVDLGLINSFGLKLEPQLSH